MKKAIDNYLSEHENEMMMALAGALGIPSVKDPSTASSRAPFGKEVDRALAYVLKTAAERQFTAENMENYVGRVRWGGDGTQYAVLTHVDVVPEGTGWSVPPFCWDRQGWQVVRSRCHGRQGTRHCLHLRAGCRACGSASATYRAKKRHHVALWYR